jgi:hypothetical protein
VDKKHRDAWVKYLVKEKKIPTAKLAKELHLTERSVFRMAAGTQTKTGPRKKATKRIKPTTGDNGKDNGKEKDESAWTVESYMHRLHALANDTKGHADAIGEHIKLHRDKLPWLEPMLDTLAGS